MFEGQWLQGQIRGRQKRRQVRKKERGLVEKKNGQCLTWPGTSRPWEGCAGRGRRRRWGPRRRRAASRWTFFGLGGWVVIGQVFQVVLEICKSLSNWQDKQMIDLTAELKTFDEPRLKLLLDFFAAHFLRHHQQHHHHQQHQHHHHHHHHHTRSSHLAKIYCK